MSESIPSEAFQFYQQAELLFSQGNIEAAISLYQSSIELNPNFSWSYHQLGEAFFRLEKWQEATSAYHHAVQLNPDFSWSYYNLGNALSELQQFSAAISAYSQAIGLDSSFAWSYYKLGVALSQESRWSEAITAYFQAIKNQLSSPEVYTKLQAAIQFESNPKSWNLSLMSDEAEVCLDIARHFAQINDLKLALVFYDIALEVQPQNIEIITESRQVREIQTQLKARIKSCFNDIKINPNSYESYYNLGVVLSQQQRWDEAIIAYLKSIELKPEMPTWMYQGLWEILNQQGKLEAAEDLYRQAVKQNKNTIWCYVNLGEILAQKGELDEALYCYKLACYQKIKQFHPDWIQNIEKLKPVSQPNFIVIGTQKGGTTSLYYYLAKHPQIMPSLIKEIDFWSTKYNRGIDWYLAHFPPILAEQKILTGEATPSYLDHWEAPERLFQTFPNTKLIVVLRNPIERAISHYYQWVNMNWEFRSLEEAMISEIEQLSVANVSYWNQPNSYIARGVYVEFLKKWLEIFPREQILIISSEKFYSNPAITLKHIFNFLDLPNYSLSNYKKYNARSYPSLDQSMRNLLGSYFQVYNQELEDVLDMKFNWNH
ncbi:sulfotransferase domain protein [Lyngbya aestuarii BL J]|uniref:Sulfotransferase domain protein n=1 Tax=Lyngbya aestuarii BL J TaxID=1348334 RepID=U7QAQ3_9CYAN|nr:tetratricopeptide repeat protein [Lyngbya aestuarii]ERT04909.1 sulfotransferase domain protein [Lyngbya aestuarii BL J]